MLDKKKFYINGQWVEPNKLNDFKVINPCNEDTCAIISLGSKEDTNTAVKSAKDAFETWKETTKEDRLNYLENIIKEKQVGQEDQPEDWKQVRQEKTSL